MGNAGALSLGAGLRPSGDFLTGDCDDFPRAVGSGFGRGLLPGSLWARRFIRSLGVPESGSQQTTTAVATLSAHGTTDAVASTPDQVSCACLKPSFGLLHPATARFPRKSAP